MSTYTLTIGLVIREGLRTWRLDRTLPDSQLSFLDQATGALKTISVAQLQRDLEAGRIQVVQEYPVALSCAEDNKLRLVKTVESLPVREQVGLRLRLGFVKHMLRRGLRRGMRRAIQAELDSLDGQLPFGVPPADVANAELSSKPQASAVMAWMRTFELSGGNPMALISGFCFRKMPRRLNTLVEEIARRKIRDFYCTRQRPSAKKTKLLIDRELGQQVARGRLTPEQGQISTSTLRRLILDISPYDRCVARFGPAYARNKWRYSLGGIDAKRPLARYEIDHTILDIVVVNDLTGLPMGRPTITVVVDAYSGYIVGMHVSFWSAGLASTLSAFKLAIRPKDFLLESTGVKNKWLACGIPDLMVVDNGLEFHSPRFHSAAAHLAMDVLHCAVRQPWLKPMVERAIGEINGALPYQGRVEKQLTNYIPEKPDKSACITFSALCKGLLKFVVDIHPFEDDERKLERAYDLYAEGLATQLPPRLPTSVEALDIIMADSKTLTIGNEGALHQYIRYNSRELQEMRRGIGAKFQTEIKINHEDIDQIWLKNPRDNSWLRVPSCYPQYTVGLSTVQHKAIRAQKKKVLSHRNAEEVLIQSKLELIDIWHTAARAGKRAKRQELLALEGLASTNVFAGTSKLSRDAASDAQRQIPISKDELLPLPKEYETYAFD
jgi:putative transposase